MDFLIPAATAVIMYSQACGPVQPELLQTAINVAKSNPIVYENIVTDGNLLIQKYMALGLNHDELQKAICDTLKSRVKSMEWK